MRANVNVGSRDILLTFCDVFTFDVRRKRQSKTLYWQAHTQGAVGFTRTPFLGSAMYKIANLTVFLAVQGPIEGQKY